MSAQPLPRITPEEYLAAHRAAEFKSEFYNGQMYAMAGGKAAHSAICLAPSLVTIAIGGSP